MEVTITRFREDIFDLVSQAFEGNDVWVTHKGRKFRIAPENQPASRLDRITPLEVVNRDGPQLNDSSLLEEMTRAWERDWSEL